MFILTRYVLRQVLSILFVTLLAMSLFLVVVLAAKESRDHGLGPVQVGSLLPYILLETLRYSVPGTILFTVCLVFGRMSGANEIVAIKSLGISPMAVLWPVYAFTFLLSLGTVWISDLAVTWGRDGIERVVVESVEEIAYGMLRTQKSYNGRTFSIIVQRVEDRRLIRPLLSFRTSDGRQSVTVRAEEAELRSDKERRELTIVCRNGTVSLDERGTTYSDPGTFEKTIPLTSASGTAGGPSSPAWMSLRAIPREIALQQRKIERLERLAATKAGLQMLTGDFEALAGPEWNVRWQELANESSTLCRLETEPYRRWATGFSCLCFVMVGAPLAIWLKRAEFWTSFSLTFLPILIVYYPLLTYAVDGAKRGSLPPQMVWLGNAILVGAGLYFQRKVVRY